MYIKRNIDEELKASGKGSMQSFLDNHNSPYGVWLSLEDFSEYENIHEFPVYGVSRLMNSRHS